MPNEVYPRMGPLARPSMHPTKTKGVEGSAGANVPKNSPFARDPSEGKVCAVHCG